MKKIIGKIHLIIGLASGLIVFMVAFTGCCWVFKEEIRAITEEEIIIESQEKAFITPSQAEEIGNELYPGKLIHGVLYDDTTKPVEIIFYQPGPLFYSSAFLNPYSGELLNTEDHLSGFFAFVLDGHVHLWMGEEIGLQVVRWTTVIFTFIVISGIILWWPRNKKNKKQRFQFQWKETTKWKRKNYDLHAIVGFYASYLLYCLFLLA